MGRCDFSMVKTLSRSRWCAQKWCFPNCNTVTVALFYVISLSIFAISIVSTIILIFIFASFSFSRLFFLSGSPNHPLKYFFGLISSKKVFLSYNIKTDGVHFRNEKEKKESSTKRKEKLIQVRLRKP